MLCALLTIRAAYRYPVGCIKEVSIWSQWQHFWNKPRPQIVNCFECEHPAYIFLAFRRPVHCVFGVVVDKSRWSYTSCLESSRLLYFALLHEIGEFGLVLLPSSERSHLQVDATATRMRVLAIDECSFGWILQVNEQWATVEKLYTACMVWAVVFVVRLFQWFTVLCEINIAVGIIIIAAFPRLNP